MVSCIQAIDNAWCIIKIITSHFYLCVEAFPTQNIFLYTFWQVPHSAPAGLSEPQMCTTQSPPHSVRLSYRKVYSCMVITGNFRQTLSDSNSKATPFVLISLHTLSLTHCPFWPPTGTCKLPQCKVTGTGQQWRVDTLRSARL